jgi:histidinol-phosphate aminotransferase
VPLVDGEDGLRADLDAVIDTARARNAKLVFLCAVEPGRQ